MIAIEPQEAEQKIRADGISVSVVVPSYNHAQFVRTTLRSIFKQLHAPRELLVIDDGSTDNSVRVIADTLNDCPFPCELIARENRGLCSTLNEGLDRSRGDYFAYLGSDDLWLPQFLSARVETLESQREAVLAYGHAFFVDEENNIVDCTADWATYADGDAREMLLQTTAPMSPTVLYRRSALDDNRWDETSKLEDYDLYLRLCVAGEFAFDSRALSAWRRHGANVSWDQALMLEAQLKAQREAALRFGFSAAEIEELQRATRFNRAEDFMRVGQKSRALGLMIKNLGGAQSPRLTGRMLMRLLIPSSFMRGRAREKQRKARERYGTIEI
jgi:alpha-1,3-rhamnosyltransferase